MRKPNPIIVNTIAELNELFLLPFPQQMFITLINLDGKKCLVPPNSNRLVFNFYSIWFKKNPSGKLGYGQNFFEFDGGSVTFQAPGQIISVYDHQFSGGWAFAFHPAFIQNYSLAKYINDYNFFSYSVNRALHLLDREEEMLVSLMVEIVDEYNNVGDLHSHDIAILKLETLLKYANRVYARQIPDFKNTKNNLLSKVETLLNQYFDRNMPLQMGVPTVKYIANELNLSAHYVGDTLKSLSGKSAQQHIHDKMIEKAKEKLSTTNLSVSEIAYELGFEHPQSFSNLFRKKTTFSPLEFRQSNN